MKKIPLFLLIFVLIFSVPSCKEKQKTEKVIDVLKIATDATWPPMEFIDENDKLTGFDIDIMNAAAEAAGYKIEIISVDWDVIFDGLAAGKYDAICSSLTITETRRETMDFSLPYINAGQVLVVRADSKATTLADMKKKTVGAQFETTGAVQIQNTEGVILKAYEEISPAIFDVVDNKIAGVVVDLPVAVDFVLRNELCKDKLKIAGEPFTDEFYGVAVKKGNKEVLDIINTGLIKVRESGKTQELIKKWLK